jgi:hypothetical protein
LLYEEHECDSRKTKDDIVSHKEKKVVYQPHAPKETETVTEKKVVAKTAAKFANSFMDKIFVKREEKLAANKLAAEELRTDEVKLDLNNLRLHKKN